MAELKRELGLRDVTLFTISCIVGTRWIAAAAHAGPGSIALWGAGALFFVVPLAIAVGGLAARHPEAGGHYLWTRADFGPWHGFLAFWAYWMGIAFWFPSATMFYMSAALSGVGLPVNRPLVLAASLAAIWGALIVNLVGMRVGKWMENVGGFSAWIVSGLFVALGAAVWWKRGAATAMNFTPAFDWATVNFWATIAYAMSGFELTGMLAGEVRDPARNLPRAGWIASGCATLFYSTATVALMVILPPDRITEMNGLAEAGAEGARTLGIGALGPVIAFLVVASGMGQLGGFGASVSRLPFAASADGLLPKAFARVHPRWHTPHVSILTLGGVATFLLLAIQLGDSLRGAYQELVSLMVITGFFPFLYIFGSSWKAGNRWSAVSGAAVTILAMLCAVVPTADTENVWVFWAKLAAGTLGVVGSAWLVYRRRARI